MPSQTGLVNLRAVMLSGTWGSSLLQSLPLFIPTRIQAQSVEATSPTPKAGRWPGSKPAVPPLVQSSFTEVFGDHPLPFTEID